MQLSAKGTSLLDQRSYNSRYYNLCFGSPETEIVQYVILVTQTTRTKWIINPNKSFEINPTKIVYYVPIVIIYKEVKA